MHNGTRWSSITCPAGNLTSFYQYIVMCRSHSRQSGGQQGIGHQRKVMGKDLFGPCVRRDKTEHQIPLVRIHTSSPTLTLHNGNAMRTAIVLVDLDLRLLMPAINDSGRYNPSKESRFADSLHQILFRLQILYQRQSFRKPFNSQLSKILNSPFSILHLHHRLGQLNTSAETPFDIAVVAKINIAFESLFERVVVIIEI